MYVSRERSDKCNVYIRLFSFSRAFLRLVPFGLARGKRNNKSANTETEWEAKWKRQWREGEISFRGVSHVGSAGSSDVVEFNDLALFSVAALLPEQESSIFTSGSDTSRAAPVDSLPGREKILDSALNLSFCYWRRTDIADVGAQLYTFDGRDACPSVAEYSFIYVSRRKIPGSEKCTAGRVAVLVASIEFEILRNFVADWVWKVASTHTQKNILQRRKTITYFYFIVFK